MEGFIALASFSLAYAFIVLLGLILLLNILGLPANWVVVLLVVLWKFLHPAAGALPGHGTAAWPSRQGGL